MLIMITEKARDIEKSKIEKMTFESRNEKNDESSNCRDDEVIDENVNDRMFSRNIERCFRVFETNDSSDEFSSLKNRFLIVMKNAL